MFLNKCVTGNEIEANFLSKINMIGLENLASQVYRVEQI